MSTKKPSLPRFGEEVPLAEVAGGALEVPDHLTVTWDTFWKVHTRGGKPHAGSAVLDACPRCRGRLTVQISSHGPGLVVLCYSCRIVLTALRLARGD